MLSKITRMLNVTVVGFIALMLAFIAISVNCDDDPEPITEPTQKDMFIKPDKIILNSESEVNDVIAQFPKVGGCPPDGAAFYAELILSKDGTDLGSISDDRLISYHYCLDDDVLQVQFKRQAVQGLVRGEAGIYTANVIFKILPLPDGSEIYIVGEDDSVNMIKPEKSKK